MTKERASIFDTADELDISGFTPKPGPDPEAVPADRVRAIAEASRFPSREAKPRPPAATPTKREPRRHRTGRTQQFSCRLKQDYFDGIYAMAASC